jgi:putative flippase GtrA
MKVLDFILYIIYTASKIEGNSRWVSNRGKTQEESARSYFRFALVSLGTIVIGTAIFSIEPYRKFLFHIMPKVAVMGIGYAQSIITAYVLYRAITKRYTDDKIKEIGLRFQGVLHKRSATLLYIVIFIVHLAVILFLVFPMLGLFADVKLRWNF